MTSFAISSTTSQNSVAYIEGRVYTVNIQQPWIEAFIVGPDGLITAVGTTEAIEAQAKKENMTIYNLNGQFVMPGIHDAHVHILFSSMANTSQIRLPVEGLTNDNVAEELKKGRCMCKYTHANQDWLVGHTYAIDDFDRRSLDREFPETPVVIRGGAGHSLYLNSEALRRAGYDEAAETDSQGGVYFRDSSGRLTGEMAENGMDKVMTTLPKPSLAHTKRCLREGIHALHKAGVTSFQEASAATLMLHAFRELDKESALKIDVYAHIVYAPDWIAEESAETLHKTLDEAATFKSKHVDTRFVKIILDGVPLSPYFSHAALQDDEQVEISKLLLLNVEEAVKEYDSRGMTVKVHCTGQGATRLALDAFKAARESNPNGPRHEIAHCSGVHDDDYVRFKALNVTAEMSPAFFFVHPVTKASGGLMDWNFPKMQNADAHVTIGSDWGAGPNPDLLPCLGSVVDSVGAGDAALGGERLCRMLSLAGAEAVGRDQEVGSIEVGKKANFIAVDKDLSQGLFEGASVLKTWFEGELVFEKE